MKLNYWRGIIYYLGLTILALLFLTPVLLMVVGSFKPDELVLAEAGSWRAFFPQQISWQNYQDVFDRVNFWRFLANSWLIAALVVSLGLVVNSLAGYSLARLRWQGRRVLLALVIALIIIPLEAIAVPLFFQITIWGWRNTYQAQIFPFIANAFSIYLFYTFFLDLPRELEEAARIDGANTWQIFAQIIIPLAKPAFASVAILTFLQQWGSFLWPLMVTFDEKVRPLPIALAAFQTLPPLQWGDVMAFGVMMVLPLTIVFLLFQKWFIKGVASTGTKG